MLFFFFHSCQNNNNQEDIFDSLNIYSEVDTNEVYIGNNIKYRIIATGLDSQKIIFPNISFNNPNISIVENNNNNKNYKLVEYELTFWDTGNFTIPSNDIKVISN